MTRTATTLNAAARKVTKRSSYPISGKAKFFQISMPNSLPSSTGLSSLFKELSVDRKMLKCTSFGSFSRKKRSSCLVSLLNDNQKKEIDFDQALPTLTASTSSSVSSFVDSTQETKTIGPIRKERRSSMPGMTLGFFPLQHFEETEPLEF